jgi:putative holliday junction resolvase
MVQDEDVRLVVVGHPLSLSGARGPQAENAEKFAQALKGVLPVPVELHDERLSTAEADRGLRAAGAPGPKRRKAVDRSAATVILQSYLDAGDH